MKNSALAQALEAARNLDLEPDKLPRITPAAKPATPPPCAARHPRRAFWRRLEAVSPRDGGREPKSGRGRLPLSAAPRGLLRAVWLRLFGPPAIDPRYDSREFGVFRAFAEVGSDYLPSSGTWPSTCDRS